MKILEAFLSSYPIANSPSSLLAREGKNNTPRSTRIPHDCKALCRRSHFRGDSRRLAFGYGARVTEASALPRTGESSEAVGLPTPRVEPSFLRPRHFINLTNGIEALRELSTLVPADEIRFTRLQSSHCESGAYDKILKSLDNELLFSLACGRSCFIYDFGSRNKARGVPRALFLGVEFVKWSLAYLWFNTENPDRVPKSVMVRGKNTVPFWRDTVLHFRISKDAKKKLRYFAPFARERKVDNINLHGVYGRVSEIDGCKDIHVKLVQDWLETQQIEAHDGDADAREWLTEHRYVEYHADSSAAELVRRQDWICGFP